MGTEFSWGLMRVVLGFPLGSYVSVYSSWRRDYRVVCGSIQGPKTHPNTMTR